MTVLQVSLPDEVKSAAEARAAAAGYRSIDAYIASLILADDLLPISAELESELLKGLNSGPAVEVTAAFLTDLKQRIRSGNTG